MPDALQRYPMVRAYEVVFKSLGRGRLVEEGGNTLDHQGLGGDGCDLGETILQGVVTQVEERPLTFNLSDYL